MDKPKYTNVDVYYLLSDLASRIEIEIDSYHKGGFKNSLIEDLKKCDEVKTAVLYGNVSGFQDNNKGE